LIPDTDPDPAFEAKYRSGSRLFMTKNCKKFTAKKELNIVLIKNCDLPTLSIYLPYPFASIKKSSNLQKKPSAVKKRTSSTSQHEIS
jgi:hypothetical protein